MSEKKMRELYEYLMKTGDDKALIAAELVGKYTQINTLKKYIKDVYNTSGLKEKAKLLKDEPIQDNIKEME